MYRRLAGIAGLVALVAIAITGGAFASASGTDDHPRTITVMEKSGPGQYVDLGKKGFTVGDEFIFTSWFYTADRSKRIGNVRGICTAITHDVSHCVGTATLLGGTAEFSAMVNGSKPDNVITLTGGTGNFLHAEGVVDSHTINNTWSRDVIHLLG
jgi:hypothetical protein